MLRAYEDLGLLLTFLTQFACALADFLAKILAWQVGVIGYEFYCESMHIQMFVLKKIGVGVICTARYMWVINISYRSGRYLYCALHVGD